jgi:hypothetical protein
VTALAPNQTALIRVTDMATGAYRQASFAIAQFTGNTPAFFTLPSSITFTGPYADVCAPGVSSGVTATDVSVYGGTPPYSISGSSSAYYVTPSTVAANGGHFTVGLYPVPATGTPLCFEGASIGVTDATGRTIIVTLNSVAGTGTKPAEPLTLSPRSLTLRLGCGESASFVVVGGTEPFSASSNHPRVSAVIATGATRTVTVTRRYTLVVDEDTAAPYSPTATVTVTDGTSSAAISDIPVAATCP